MSRAFIVVAAFVVAFAETGCKKGQVKNSIEGGWLHQDSVNGPRKFVFDGNKYTLYEVGCTGCVLDCDTIEAWAGGIALFGRISSDRYKITIEQDTVLELRHVLFFDNNWDMYRLRVITDNMISLEGLSVYAAVVGIDTFLRCH